MPSKKSNYSGVYKYNEELIKIKKKKSIIHVLHTGNSKLYLITFFYKFIILPSYLLFYSNKFDSLVLPEEGYIFLRLFSFAKKNTIIIHDYRESFIKSNKVKFNEKIKQLYLDINFLFLSKCKNIVVPSNFTKNQLIKYLSINSDNIYVIPNIINFLKKKPKYNSKFQNLKKNLKKIKTVMCVTSNETRKNLKLLYKIIRKSKNINFVIVGNINNNLNLNNVFYFRNISDENLIYLFKISKVFLDVSLYEGFGRTLVEAQYFKLKVVCFDTETNKEILSNTATLINKNTKIKKIINYLNTNSSSNQKLRFFKNSKKYSQISVYKKFKKEINEI